MGVDYSQHTHNIKHRAVPNDEFYTPRELAKLLICRVPLVPGDVVLDAARGQGSFYDSFPNFTTRDWCDVDMGFDFLEHNIPVDWVITNPPYSNLDAWFAKAVEISRKGFAYLLGFINITPRRVELANKAGFGLDSIYLCKVFQWFGISAFVVFRVGSKNIIDYDRVVWK